jgi:succinate-semialdehyde dehydrogenase/glutarate-semialdehyde dehydrogenase
VPAERSKIMRKAAALMRERAGDIAPLLTQEQGKPLVEAKGEAMAAVDIIEWFADEGMRVYGRIVASRANLAIRQMVLKDPVGPVAAFTPWNFPINQVVRKIGAALAAGCSVIVKAPEETPAAPAALVKAFGDAGLPPGVLGLVYGNPAEISSYLIPHPVVRKVTFTGSIPVGKQLAALAGQHMKRATMELGGHAPVIVCEDADIALAVKTAAASKFRNAGQVCISPTRFLVHKSVASDFAQALADHAKGLKVGDGLTDGTQMGPLANSRRIDAMSAFTEDAVKKGAKLLAGGQRIGSAGNFWQPTVFTDVPREAKIFNDEPFGPMAAIRPFDTLEDAIREANRLPYGLAGYGFTKSLKNADLLARRLEVGMVWINMPAMPSAEMPFGGVKDSGYGSEGGPEALEAYLNTRAIATANV